MSLPPGIIFRIFGGIFLICLSIGFFGIVTIPAWFLGILALVAGGALLAGL